MINRFQMLHRLLVFTLLISISSCTLLTQTQRGAYSEDLSKHRKTFKAKKITHDSSQPVQYWDTQKHIPITSLQAVTEQLDVLLERKKLASEQVRHITGYTIQVYTGGSREAAFKVRNQLLMHYAALKPEIKYNLPNYTVRIGKFLDKLEAYAVYAAIKKQMPQAIIRPISLVNAPRVFSKPTED